MNVFASTWWNGSRSVEHLSFKASKHLDPHHSQSEFYPNPANRNCFASPLALFSFDHPIRVGSIKYWDHLNEWLTLQQTQRRIHNGKLPNEMNERSYLRISRLCSPVTWSSVFWFLQLKVGEESKLSEWSIFPVTHLLHKKKHWNFGHVTHIRTYTYTYVHNTVGCDRWSGKPQWGF